MRFPELGWTDSIFARGVTLDAFAPLENDYPDAVAIKTEWFKMDCDALRMPLQAHGAITELDEAGRAYIEEAIADWKKNPAEAPEPGCAEHNNPILNFTAFDCETASNDLNAICQVGVVRFVNGVSVEKYCSLIQPPRNYIGKFFTSVHGITSEETRNAPTFKESFPLWRHMVEGQVLVAHNARYDKPRLIQCAKEFCGLDMNFKTYCTCKTWKGAFEEGTTLDICCEKLGIDLGHHHDALDDALACGELFVRAVEDGRELKEQK
jgi:DNA polymerase-3 subunit epsilon